MTIVGGFDLHRAQITFDALNLGTGEVLRGRIPATPAAVRGWVERFPGEEVHVAVEACTGWLFVCEALAAAAAVPHLAEPAETAARRGSKHRAKTDRADARHLRTLLCEGHLPRPGSRPSTCAAGAPAPGFERRSSMSAPPGFSGSRRPSFTTASRGPRTSSEARAAGHSSTGSRCPPTPASGSRSRSS